MTGPDARRGRKSNREAALAIPGDLIDTALGLPPSNGGTVLAQPTAASLLRLFNLIPTIVYVHGGTALHANNDVLLQEEEPFWGPQVGETQSRAELLFLEFSYNDRDSEHFLSMARTVFMISRSWRTSGEWDLKKGVCLPGCYPFLVTPCWSSDRVNLQGWQGWSRMFVGFLERRGVVRCCDSRAVEA